MPNASRTRAPRRSGRKDYDVETLLAVASRVFMRKGFDGTSMEDLSRELGITKSAIYHHVSGKAELLDRAVSRGLDGLDGVMDRALALDGTPLERLEYLITGSVELLVAEKPFVTLLLRVHGNSPVERRALARRKAFDERVAELVAAAAADGAVRSDIDPEMITRLVFGMVNSLVEWVRPAAGAATIAQAVREIAFGGIQTR